MNKYIVSLVFARTIPAADLGDKPDISLQNVVGIATADNSTDAYNKVAQRGKLQHPDHNIVVRVVVEMNEAMAETIN